MAVRTLMDGDDAISRALADGVGSVRYCSYQWVGKRKVYFRSKHFVSVRTIFVHVDAGDIGNLIVRQGKIVTYNAYIPGPMFSTAVHLAVQAKSPLCIEISKLGDICMQYSEITKPDWLV
jgi:hypothetical protein